MSYPWIKDGQYVTPAATNYLAVTSPNGLYLTDGVSPATIITPTSVTATTFYGTLNGTVTNATNATNATNVAITDDGTTNAAFYPVFVSTNSGNLALKVDKTTTPFSYVPSTGMLTTTKLTTGGNYGSAQQFYASTADLLPLQLTSQGINNEQKFFKIVPASAIINYITTRAEQYNGTGYAQLQLNSGDITTTPPRVLLESFVDYDASPAYGGCNNSLDMNGNTLTITNGNAGFDLPENSITMSYNSSYSNNYIQQRVAFDSVGNSSFQDVGYEFYTLNIALRDVFKITNTSTKLNIYRITTFGQSGGPGTTGITENSVINTTTTGSTTILATAAFTTIINTPTAAGRIFVLPTPSAGTIGYWYAFCNKSAGNIITINSSSGVAQITIPAGLAGGAGGYGAVAVDSAGTGYFRCG